MLGGLAWQLAGGLIRTPDWSSITELAVVAALVGTLATVAAAATAPRAPDLSVLHSE